MKYLCYEQARLYACLWWLSSIVVLFMFVTIVPIFSFNTFSPLLFSSLCHHVHVGYLNLTMHNMSGPGDCVSSLH